MENIGIMNERLSLCLENRLPELDRLRDELECFLERCGVGGRESYHIQLALDELVTNIILYAYSAQGGHTIAVDVQRLPGRVDMVIADTGRPFNPLEAPVPDTSAPGQERPIGGLGIHFVRKTMDCLAYERQDGRNILRFCKKTP